MTNITERTIRDAFAEQFPQLAETKPAASTKQRRYKPKEIAPNNEIAYEDPLASIRNTPEGMFAPPKELIQAVQNMGSGVLQIPTDVGAMVDMVRVGVPSVFSSIPDDGSGQDYLGRLGPNFMNGVFDEQAQQMLTDQIKGKIEEFRTAKPDATPEQIDAFLDQYQDTQEYFDAMTSLMSPGFKWAQYANDWANNVVGLDKRPDQQTIVDEIEQVLGQSIVGLPMAARKAIGSMVRQRVGATIADNMATKVALKGAEIVTPLTLPLTPGNVALNTGVGAGINEVMRDLTNQPSLMNGNEDLTPLVPFEPADGHGENIDGQSDNAVLNAGVTLASFFAFPAFRRQATDAAKAAATNAVDKSWRNAGPTIADQSTELKPMLAPTTGMIDSNAPIKKGANLFDADDDVLDYLDAQLSGASTVNRVEAEINAVNYGILANHPETVPMVRIREQAAQLAPEEYELLNNYLYATQRRQDTMAYSMRMTDELRNKEALLNGARVAGDTRGTNRLQQEVAEMKTKLAQLQADTPEQRTMMQDWSNGDVQAFLNAGEANPNVQAISKSLRTLNKDLNSFLRKNGVISPDEEILRNSTRPLWVPVRERSRADAPNGVVRAGLLFGDRILGRVHKQPFTDKAVNRPKDALTAMQEGVMDAVRNVTANNARRNVVDTLKGLNGAEGRLLRQYEFDIGGRKVRSISDAQYDKYGKSQMSEDERKNSVRITRDGKNEFWTFSDPAMTKSLQFAPLASVPLMNVTRKAWQTTTTGLAAPWFALKSTLWDVPLARTTMRQGRSLGLMDTWARRLFNENNTVGAIMDHVPDPTAWVSMAGAVPYQMTMRAARAVGQKISQDLQGQSGIFNMMAQVPGGKEMLDFVGESMVKSFDRSAYNVYSRHLSTALSHLTDAARIGDDYASAAGKTSGPLRSMFNVYKAGVESIQNATRMAFFAENYGRLKIKHQGKIPKIELDKLVQETRVLTGDMSRTSLSPTIQKITSVIPYGNPIIQGTRHMLSALIPPSVAKGVNAVTGGRANMTTNRTNRFWSQFIGGVVLPSLGSAAFIDSWPGAQDWWYNKVPEWQRGSTIPFPTAEAIQYRWENGEWPTEFDPKYVNMLPLAPELSMIQAPIMSGLRALGAFGPAQQNIPTGIGKDMSSAFDQITSFATPPLLQAFFAANGERLDLRAGLSGQGFTQPIDPLTFGGANADNLTYNGELPRALYDVMGALMSSTGHLLVQSLNVADTAMDDGDDFFTASQKALETVGYEVKRKLPTIDIPTIFQAERRNYAFTPESEFVYDTERQLEPLIGGGRQQSVETDSKERIEMLENEGLIAPNQISDPLLQELSQVVYDTLRKKGPYKQATEQYTDLRVQLNALEASRAKWPEDAYAAKYNELVSDQQKLKEVQARLLTQLHTELNDQYGAFFEQYAGQPFSFKTLSDAVRANVASQGGS